MATTSTADERPPNWEIEKNETKKQQFTGVPVADQ